MKWLGKHSTQRGDKRRTRRMALFGTGMLVLGVGVSMLVVFTGLVSGQTSKTPADVVRQLGAVPVCIQKTGSPESVGDLNVDLSAACADGQRPLKLAMSPGEFGVVNVYVSRGSEPRARWATYSGDLGSPFGTTIGGHFRFSCSPAHAPCKVTYGVSALSGRTGTIKVYPKLAIHKQDGAAAAETFCEYADGADNGGTDVKIDRVRSLSAVNSSLEIVRPMGVGSSFDCGAGQAPPGSSVQEIWVPAGTDGTSTAYYDVWTTMRFR